MINNQSEKDNKNVEEPEYLKKIKNQEKNEINIQNQHLNEEHKRKEYNYESKEENFSGNNALKAKILRYSVGRL